MLFVREETTAGAEGAEVRFTLTAYSRGESAAFPAFRIIASKRGVRFEGHSGVIMSQEELEKLAHTVSQAWAAHRKLLTGQIAVVGTMPR